MNFEIVTRQEMILSKIKNAPGGTLSLDQLVSASIKTLAEDYQYPDDFSVEEADAQIGDLIIMMLRSQLIEPVGNTETLELRIAKQTRIN